VRPLGVLLAVFLIVAGASPAVADDLEDQLVDVSGDIGDVRSALHGAEADQSGIAAAILDTDDRLRRLVGDLAQTEADLAAVTADVDRGRANLNTIRAELEARYAALERTRVDLSLTRERARQRALEIYMVGGQDLGSLVFGADQVTELSVGLQYANQVMDATDRLVKGLTALERSADQQATRIAGQEREMDADVELLESHEGVISELRARVAEQKQSVEQQLAQQQNQLAQLKEEISFFEDELVKLEQEQGRVEALIRQQQEEEAARKAAAEAAARAAAEENDGGGGSDDDAADDGAGSGGGSGSFIRPVPGRITSSYGYRIHPIYGTRKLHAGVDMTASSGTPIKAADSGRIILASWYGGYGNAVIIDHGDGLATLYAHQSSLAVSYGDRVSAGEVIGYVGNTGLSTGAHLHFEVRVNGSPVDPVPYL